MDIEQLPSFDSETLRYTCSDPFDGGRYTFHFTDGTALLVGPEGRSSRWVEEPAEVASWAGGRRVRWTTVPVAVREEAWRRALELSEMAE